MSSKYQEMNILDAMQLSPSEAGSHNSYLITNNERNKIVDFFDQTFSRLQFSRSSCAVISATKVKSHLHVPGFSLFYHTRFQGDGAAYSGLSHMEYSLCRCMLSSHWPHCIHSQLCWPHKLVHGSLVGNCCSTHGFRQILSALTHTQKTKVIRNFTRFK